MQYPRHGEGRADSEKKSVAVSPPIIRFERKLAMLKGSACSLEMGHKV